ncbi:uncharacterized protein EV422DRAFT_534952 [Fimicolochytrium jonesii]|uniref:uncharacterized protein n=1 Tax=Fimicolochytrium jonesii TaxID=1396493 RepID=UPI0022FE5182|nr:uncharacterized protein EV422DRAFT_534952 [Fimicolochytrium jonesii]KAI8819497.1 hypothetical protein EV422DRAFT_534952 [Fimicolochytrium jonesii]
MTALHIGYPCDKLPFADDTDPYLDKIGGRPVWFTPHRPPPATWSTCTSCTAPLFLIAQLLAQRAEFDKPDRVLYIFGCNRRMCGAREGSWRCVKAVKRRRERVRREAAEVGLATPKKEKANVFPDTPTTTMTGNGKNGFQTPVTTAATVATPPSFLPTPATFSFGDTFTGPTPTKTPMLFGSESPAPASPSPAPSPFGFAAGSPAPSPASDLQSLLELRDRKYGWGDDEDEDGAAEKQKKPKKKKTKKKPKNGEGVVDRGDTLVDGENDATAALPEPNTELTTDPAIEALTASLETNLTLSTPTLTWSSSPTFPAYPLEFVPEPSDTPSEDTYAHELALLAEYQRTETTLDTTGPTTSNSAEDATWTGETYEKTAPKHYTKSFKRFAKCVEADPEQCVRYGVGGEVVHYRESRDDKGRGKCTRCGGDRVFECQLMPMVLGLLPTEECVPRAVKRAKDPTTPHQQLPSSAAQQSSNSLPSQPPSPHKSQREPKNTLSTFLDRHAAGMDFGTVIVYTCAVDCEGRDEQQEDGQEDDAWGVTYSEERVVVEMESLV